MSISPPQSSGPCPQCSTEISSSFVYCPTCGYSIPSDSTKSLRAEPPLNNGISISRSGQVFGPYPREIIEKWIASGQVQRHELGCRDMDEGWQPLGKLLWPDTFASAGTFSRKQWGWIIAAIVGFVALAALASKLDNQRPSSSAASPEPRTTQSAKVISEFERGEQYYANGSYFSAKAVFEKIGGDDPKFAEAQARLKLIKQNLAEQEQREKRKEALRKKYEKLCHSGLYLYQIEQRLQREDFHMDNSGFEKAPDGSTGVRQYFSKTTDDGTIKIWTQSAYSLSYYYCNVTVQ